MRKPDECLGCPLYGDGDGFVPDEIIPGARVYVMLQNPGEREEMVGRPAVGATGDILNESFLPQGALTRGVDVSVGNALRCRWRDPLTKLKTNTLPPKKVLDAALGYCRQYDSKPNGLVVAAGSAAWAATGQTGTISDWRGFVGPNRYLGSAVLGVLHPADLFRDPKMRLACMKDWRKVQDVLTGTWPRAVPPVQQVPYTASVESFVQWTLELSNLHIGIDTEYDPHSRELSLLGLGLSTGGYQVWWTQLDDAAKRAVSSALYRLVNRNVVVFQNSFADIPVIQNATGVRYSAYKGIEDTMLAHAVLWSEWPHGLEFLASIYGKHHKMKHLAASNPSLYNWGDVLETLNVHEGLKDEFRRDPDSERVYRSQSLPLIPVLLKSMERGLKINAGRVRDSLRQFRSLLDQSQLLAQAHMGWPINLGSEKQLKNYLYNRLRLPVQKHKDTKKPSIGADALSVLRRLVGPDWSEDEEESVKRSLDRVARGADPVIEARVLYAAAQQTLTHYIEPLVSPLGGVVARVHPQFKIHAQASGRWSTTDPPMAQLPSSLCNIVMPDNGDIWIGWDWDAIELRVLAALANDAAYLEAFEKNWDVHSINTQDIFWGTTKESRLAEAMSKLREDLSVPAISGVNSEMVLQLVSQFKTGMDGTVDWSELLPEVKAKWEARVRAPRGNESWPGRGCAPQEWLSSGQFTGEPGKDYTRRARALAYAAWVACGGPPPDWLAKNDIRRLFAKRFVFRLNYGGEPKLAGDIPGAKILGLGARDLVVASRRYLSAHPAMAAWRTQVASDTRATGVSRTFMGRRRRLLAGGRGSIREAFNHPMQGGVADILNLVTVRIAHALPYANLAYTVHDAAWWAVPVEKEKEAFQVIRPIVESEWDVQGVNVVFPATFKWRLDDGRSQGLYDKEGNR